MMKKLIALMLFALLLSACSDGSSEDDTATTVFWIFLIVCAVVAFVALGMHTDKKEKKIKEDMESQGLKAEDFVDLGMYASGHPDLNDSIKGIKIRKNDVVLDIYEWPYTWEEPKKKAEIPIADISNITIQDATTIEKKITVGRMILVGVFAFAWKKKKKNEIAFVEIDWKKGKFDNETMFCFEGKDAAQRANKARNELMKLCQ